MPTFKNYLHRLILSPLNHTGGVTPKTTKARNNNISKISTVAIVSSLVAINHISASADSCTAISTTINSTITDECQLSDNEAVIITNTGSIANTLTGISVNGTSGISIINDGTLTNNLFGEIYNNSTSEITTLINNGTISGNSEGIYNEGNINTLSNTGSISTQFTISNYGTINSLTNFGTLNGSYEGIYNEGSINMLTNNNSVIGGDAAIVNIDGTIITLINIGTINGTLDGVFNNDGGNINTLSNTGSISSYYAIDNFGTINLLTNSGSINGDYDGIYNNGNISSLTNSGMVIADYAIDNDGGTINTLMNSGTINGNIDGIYNSGIINTLINNGTIRGSQAIDNSSGTITNGITNTGTLDGLVFLGNATLNLNGNHSQVTQLTTGGSSAVVNVNGNFTAEDNFEVGYFNITSGGTLNMANQSITTNNGVINNGTLVITDQSTATIIGNFSQTANGMLAVNATGNHGQLLVNGTATFDANSNISVNVASSNTLTNGTTLTSVVNANTLIASTINVTDNSVLFDFNPTINSSTIDLIAIASNTSNVYQSVKNNNFTSGLNAALILNQYIDGSISGTDISNVTTKLGQLSTQTAVSNAVAQTLPVLTSGTSRVSLQNQYTLNNIIADYQATQLGLASGDDFHTSHNAWIKPFGAWAHQDSRDNASGYNAKTTGLVFGINGATPSHTNHIGFAFAYTNSNIDSTSDNLNQCAKIESYQAFIYGNHHLLDNSDTTLLWQANTGLNKNTTSRYMQFIDRTAKAKYDTKSAHIGFDLGRAYKLNAKTQVRPALRADYTWIQNESYAESGADALNLKVNQITTDELILMFDNKLLHLINDRTNLFTSLGIGYDILNHQDRISAQYEGGGASFIVRGMKVTPWVTNANVGLMYKLKETTELSAYYTISARESYLNQIASIKFNWLF